MEQCAQRAQWKRKYALDIHSMGDSNTVVSAYAVLLSPIDTSLNKITMDDFKTALSLSLPLGRG